MIGARPGTIVAMERVINKASHATVTETAARLIAEVEARGMKLFTTIDHSAEARATGLEGESWSSSATLGQARQSCKRRPGGLDCR